MTEYYIKARNRDCILTGRSKTRAGRKVVQVMIPWSIDEDILFYALWGHARDESDKGRFQWLPESSIRRR